MKTDRWSLQLQQLLGRFSGKRLRRVPSHELRITTATYITCARIALAPFIVLAMVSQYWGVAFLLFIVAAISDIADGMIARLCNQKTFLGACLDPIADKCMLISCFATLAFVQSPLFSIPRWFVLLVLCKEILQISGAWVIYLVRGHINIKPTLLGKLTTLFQMGFITWLFACYFFNWLPIKTYYTMLGTMVFLTCASFVHYATIGMSALLTKDNK